EAVQLALLLVPVGAQPLEHAGAVLERGGQDVHAGVGVRHQLAVHQQIRWIPLLRHDPSEAPVSPSNDSARMANAPASRPASNGYWRRHRSRYPHRRALLPAWRHEGARPCPLPPPPTPPSGTTSPACRCSTSTVTASFSTIR